MILEYSETEIFKMLEKYLNMTKDFASKLEGVLEIPALKFSAV